MAKTYVIGHTKPDTDAVVAAMALQYFYDHSPHYFSNAEAVVADPLNPETKYLFEKFGVAAPRLITAQEIEASDRIVLVDHNEESQRLTGINPEQIVDVVDHHKANLNLPQPIFMTFKAWGSSSTIVYHLMEQQNITPDKSLASLMLAAVLSDTVGYKSSTTTKRDQEVGQKLAKLAEISDVAAFTLEIFKAKSDISQLSAQEIVLNDYKIFEFGSQKVLIDQIETVEQDQLLNQQKTALLEAMAQVRSEQGVDQIFVAVTDVLKVNTKLLVASETEQTTAEAAFGGRVSDHILDIGPKLSRKKEIAPAIEQAVK